MRVLLVEDHPKLAMTVANGLRRLGMAVDVAFDGHDALAHTAIIDYDVVVLDRNLPGLHGDEVCKQLVREGRDCKVLMLTAAASVDDRVEGLRLGADDDLLQSRFPPRSSSHASKRSRAARLRAEDRPWSTAT